MWEGNKSQAGALESIILDGAKRILGCSSKTCNEAVRRDMGLDTLQSHRERAKLKWWYKLATLPEDRYSRGVGRIYSERCEYRSVSKACKKYRLSEVPCSIILATNYSPCKTPHIVHTCSYMDIQINHNKNVYQSFKTCITSKVNHPSRWY